ncbi:hypothetical protein Pcinc_030322 [Petrolisthes cinctipes]|uniref:Uncharacterized protein n=1 Tax=Petrolisthes cinctipes TaxID=88211 RepID=A0AAE1K674_PETCI|nr:hypothetical protein Pcinc_030322 [Petrolisthes cinctipes]
MKVLAVLLGVSLVLGVSTSQVAEEKADDTPVQAKEVKVEAEDSDLQAQESRRVENKVKLQTHIEGQLATAEIGQDSSFHIDSRAGVTNLQGAVPKDNILHNHEKLTQYSQEAAQKVHSAYSTGVVSNLYADAPYQWAYEVMAPSTGDYQSRVEHRQQDGLVRGRYSLVDPDGSLRVVSYIAHPEDGFKATVEKHPVTTSNNNIQTYNNQQRPFSTPQQQQQQQFTTNLHQNQPQQQQQHLTTSFVNQQQQSIQPQTQHSDTLKVGMRQPLVAYISPPQRLYQYTTSTGQQVTTPVEDVNTGTQAATLTTLTDSSSIQPNQELTHSTTPQFQHAQFQVRPIMFRQVTRFG